MALNSVYRFVMSLLDVGKWSPLQMAPKTVVICVSSCLVLFYFCFCFCLHKRKLNSVEGLK